MAVASISRHLKNIFESSELQKKKSVVSILETTATDGKRYRKRYYNLDAIIAVGYRVNSFEATQFRIWATRTLREYIVKGFVLDNTPAEGSHCYEMCHVSLGATPSRQSFRILYEARP